MVYSVIDSKANQGSVLRLIQILAKYDMDAVSLCPFGKAFWVYPCLLHLLHVCSQWPKKALMNLHVVKFTHTVFQ